MKTVGLGHVRAVSLASLQVRHARRVVQLRHVCKKESTDTTVEVAAVFQDRLLATVSTSCGCGTQDMSGV